MHDWYLNDWLKTLEVIPAELGRLTDYPKAKVSDLCNGHQRYNRDIVNDIAIALNIEPFELLMHPADAMRYRRMERLATQMVQPEFGGVAIDIEEEAARIRKAG